MNIKQNTQIIEADETALGIELGSTQIKAVLIDTDARTIAEGSYVWENDYQKGIWTYSLTDVWQGIQASYQQLAANVQSKYHISLKKIGAIGVSAMMHGYLVFDQQGQQLVPFRTWRNNITQDAADELTQLFNFNIPLRWSIAHLYHAILHQEKHVNQINYMTTLAGYVHWQLSGKKMIGIGDASGMFPIDDHCQFNSHMIEQFNEIPRVKKYSWKLADILPTIKIAGQPAGHLTKRGAKLLDPTGVLQSGSIMAAPEGDAGTGMISTNSVRLQTGNISVGTSAFSMVVLDKPLKNVHRDIDLVNTPTGLPVAMVHINNCSSDINAWTNLFKEFATRLGLNISSNKLYETLFLDTVKSDSDAGGLINYSYLSGENITDIKSGRPLFVRTPESRFTLANFMLAQLYSAFAPLKIGMDILTQKEDVHPGVMIAQGGLFKTPVIAQQVLANALNIPIAIMNNASVGGPWGMAVLALYTVSDSQQSLSDYLDTKIFANADIMTISPVPQGVQGYEKYIKSYQKGLTIEEQANALAD